MTRDEDSNQPLIRFAVALFLLYSSVPILLKMSKSKILKLSLLTLDMCDVLIRIVAYDKKMHGLYVIKLVRSFFTSSNETNDDPFDHVGSILVNISKKESGRNFVLDPKRGLLKQIIRQFDSRSLLRKEGNVAAEYVPDCGLVECNVAAKNVGPYVGHVGPDVAAVNAKADCELIRRENEGQLIAWDLVNENSVRYDFLGIEHILSDIGTKKLLALYVLTDMRKFRYEFCWTMNKKNSKKSIQNI